MANSGIKVLWKHADCVAVVDKCEHNAWPEFPWLMERDKIVSKCEWRNHFTQIWRFESVFWIYESGWEVFLRKWFWVTLDIELCNKTVFYAFNKCHLSFSTFQASMLSTPDGPFINLARLNFAKYAARPNLAKVDKLYMILRKEHMAYNAIPWHGIRLVEIRHRQCNCVSYGLAC